MARRKPYSGPPNGGIQPDAAAMFAFLSWWFEFCTAGHVEIAWKSPATGGVDQVAHFPLGAEGMFDAAGQAARVTGMPGCDVYFCASTVAHSGRRAEDADFVQAPGPWLDQDDPADVQRANTVTSLVQPHCWTITGTVPSLRRQGMMRADQPIADAKALRDLNKRLQMFFGGDPAVVNPTRVMRLPGSIAWPYKPGGRMPELTWWEQNARAPTEPYSLADMQAKLPAVVAPERQQSNASQDGRVDRLIADARANAGEWHASVLKLTGYMVGKGMPDSVILALAESLTQGDHTVEETVEDMQRMIDGARGKLNIPDSNPIARDIVEEGRAAFEQAGPLPAPPVLPEKAKAEKTESFPPGAIAPPAGEHKKFRFLSPRELWQLHAQPPEFLIHGVLQRGVVCLVTGVPGSGKSPIVQDWVAHMLVGLPWDGHRTTTQCCGIVVSSESDNQFARNIFAMVGRLLKESGETSGSADQTAGFLDNRLLALTSRTPDGVRNPPFFLEQDTLTLLAAMQEECAAGGRLGRPPDFIVLDTLRAMSIGSLNSDEDMALVQQAIGLIRQAFPFALIVVISHAAKSDPLGQSGSNRIPSFSEVIVAVVPIERDMDTDDDDTFAKRLKMYGPDSNGYKYANMRIVFIRNKDWPPEKSKRAIMRIRDSDIEIDYGARATAIEYMALGAPERKPGRDKAPPPMPASTATAIESEPAAFAAPRPKP